MPPPRTFSQKSALLSVRAHLAFTVRRLLANPLTSALAPVFQGLIDEWSRVFQIELDLNDAIDDAQVAVEEVDERLNRFADRTAKEILLITGGNRSDPLYIHFFQNKQLSVFKRPLLGGQLDSMKKWPDSFSKSEHASLQALGPELVPLLAEANAAAAAKVNAEHQRNEFRDLGGRKKHIDRVNAARKEVYGSLSTLPHKHAGLPSSFADRFFRRDTTAGEVDEEPTIEEVEQQIVSLKAQLVEQERLLQALKDAAAEAATKEQEREAAEAKLAQLEQEMAQKQREAESIRAELAKKRG